MSATKFYPLQYWLSIALQLIGDVKHDNSGSKFSTIVLLAKMCSICSFVSGIVLLNQAIPGKKRYNRAGVK
jgi:hypothetical protein